MEQRTKERFSNVLIWGAFIVLGLTLILGILGICLQNDVLSHFSDLSVVFGIILTFGSFVISFRQTSKKDALQFLIDLQRSFFNDPEINAVYQKLESGTLLDLGEDGLGGKDRLGVQKYISHFDFVYLLYQNGDASLAEIDDIFSYYLFDAANNEQIQKNCIKQYYCYYPKFIKLYRIFRNYHQKMDLDIINEGKLSLETFLKEIGLDSEDAVKKSPRHN